METHLKDKAYYEKLYDQITVNSCRHIEEFNRSLLEDKKYVDNKELASIMPGFARIQLYYEKGERYLSKEDTIYEWMEEDRKRDDILQSAKQPYGVRCTICYKDMDCTFRTLEPYGRVLFIFHCSNKCGKGQALFEDGSKWSPEPTLCSSCNAEMLVNHEREDKTITTLYTCEACGFQDSEEMTLGSNKEQEDPLFEEDRAKYCLTPQEGMEYAEGKRNMEELKKVVDKMKEKEDNKELYDRVAQLKRLTIMQLEEFLVPALEKENYMRFELGKPEMGKDVFVEFSVREGMSDRAEYDSKNQLKRLIQKTLEDTNWRLMSEGISYRLGYLTGRLRAYEKEDDLISLMKKKEYDS